MKIGIFFGSTTGTCEALASKIAAEIGVGSADVHNVTELNEAMVADYEMLVLGSSTWGCGDLQDDWYDGLSLLKNMDLKGKKIALFSCGDSSNYSDTFCNAMGTMYDDLQSTGALFVGTGVSTGGYTFDDSTAVRDGLFVGLALDEVNEDFKTDERIKSWVHNILSL